MRIAYFTNQYPAVSHTFIRREICALEMLDVIVIRYALCPAAEDFVDPADLLELRKTRYVLRAGVAEVLRYFIFTIVKQPLAVVNVFVLAAKIGWKSDRGILRHFFYVVEAIVLATWCRQDNVQHLHAHFGTNSAAVAMLASLFSGIPYSFTVHGPDEFEKAHLLALDEKLRQAAFAVCVSSFGKSQLMRWSPPDQWRKIEIVHCGVDSVFLDSAVQPPPSVRRFVCVGRLVSAKAQLILVNAVRRLHESGINCEVALVGDGPMRNFIEDAIRDAGLLQQITITGWGSGQRVKAEMLASRALVLPSFSENLPVVIMEAMALARPVISTYIAGIPELVRPGETGWLVPASDDVALAEAMREALDASLVELAAMGEAGRRRIIAHHDVLKQSMKLKLLFERTECT